MSTIQELGAFLTREQAAGIASAPTPATTPAKEPAVPASSPSPTVELPATEAAFNTDHNGAPTARPG
jgi:hypothetical protein